MQERRLSDARDRFSQEPSKDRTGASPRFLSEMRPSERTNERRRSVFDQTYEPDHTDGVEKKSDATRRRSIGDRNPVEVMASIDYKEDNRQIFSFFIFFLFFEIIIYFTKCFFPLLKMDTFLKFYIFVNAVFERKISCHFSGPQHQGKAIHLHTLFSFFFHGLFNNPF